MAVKTFYLNNTVLATSVWALSETAKAAVDANTYLTVAKNATGYYGSFVPGANATVVNTEASGATALTKGWATDTPLSGSFAAGTWTLSFKLKNDTSYTSQKGYVKITLAKVSAYGQTPVATFNGAWASSAQMGFTATNQYVTGTVAITTAAPVMLNNEYLMLSVEWACSVSSGGTQGKVYFCVNDGAEYLTTPDYTPNTPPTVALNTPADAATVATGTPTLEFTGTDSVGEDVAYQVQVDASATFNSSVASQIAGQLDPTSGATFGLGSGTTSAIGQSFTGDGATLSRVSFRIVKDDGHTPAGNIGVAKLYANSGTYGSGIPTGAPLAVSTNVFNTANYPLGSDWFDFTFNPYVLTNGGIYFVVLEYTGTLNLGAGNGLSVYLGTGADGNAATYSGSTWSVYAGSDVNFKVTTSVPAAVIDRVSSTDLGFTNTVTPADTSPFNSGEKVGYTVPDGVTKVVFGADAAVTSYTSVTGVGTSDVVAVGNAFTASASYAIGSVIFKLSKRGVPTGTLKVELYAATGTVGSNAKPTGSPIATSTDSVAVTTLTSTPVSKEFSFGPQATLVGGVSYCVVVRFTGGAGNDSNNALLVGTAASSLYEGNACLIFGSGTTDFDSSNDTIFQIKATPPNLTLPPGTYYWRVRGIDPAGTNTYGAWSATRSFTVGSSGTYSVTGSGGARAGGSAAILQGGSQVASGGARAGGSADIVSSSGVATYSVDGTGGARAGGSATVLQGATVPGTGGGRAGGTATISTTATYPVSGAGGGRAGGSATIAALATFSLTGSGGGRAGGSGLIAATATYDITGSSGAVAGGTAAVLRGANLSGSGGGRAGGTSTIAANYNAVVVGQGGAFSGGSAAIIRNQQFVSSGGGVAGGDAMPDGAVTGTASYLIGGSGGGVAGGTAFIVRAQSCVGQGGAVSGGSGHTAIESIIVAGGGGSAGGAAAISAGVIVTPSGGGIGGGAAGAEQSYIFPTSTGGGVVGGSSTITASQGIFVGGSGGSVAGGAAALLRGVFNPGGGGAVAGGAAGITSSAIIASSGGVVAAGSADISAGVVILPWRGGIGGHCQEIEIERGVSVTSVGGGSAGGSAKVIRIADYRGTGGAVAGGSADTVAARKMSVGPLTLVLGREAGTTPLPCFDQQVTPLPCTEDDEVTTLIQTIGGG